MLSCLGLVAILKRQVVYDCGKKTTMIILVIIAIRLLLCGIGVGLVLLNAWLRESNEKLFDLTKHLDKEEKHYE